jgi:SAM-dependent MidA family methyltransferase
VSQLSQIIRAETALSGVLPFARFMELALYCPIHGYYEKQKDNVGRGGDFITSVSTGGLFGQLLAFQFAGWLEGLLIADCGLWIVEAGAHDGRLAGDILTWLQANRPELFARLEYCLIEPSTRRQIWQRETLKPFAPRVRWHSNFSELVGRDSIEPESGKIHGIIFSNELLDAMPVHRHGWDAKNKRWFEWGVAIEGEKIVWARVRDNLQPSTFNLQPSGLESLLPDGFTIETSPAAESWWREAAGVLEYGKLVTIDYGFTGDKQFSPSRTNGTLRAYFRHHVSDDLLANVGEQDLTAHVNFSAVQKAGEKAGLKTEMFSTQTKFLTQILERTLADKSFGDWTPARTRQFQTLTHPEHLGRAFRVLVQSR